MSLFDHFRIVVQEHAVYQFAMRFIDQETHLGRQELYAIRETIGIEVREGFKAGRASKHKPPSLHPPDDPDSLYVWTPDGSRIYAIHHNDEVFAVMTTMKAER